jgi:hypothetical protein
VSCRVRLAVPRDDVAVGVRKLSRTSTNSMTPSQMILCCDLVFVTSSATSFAPLAFVVALIALVAAAL